MKQYTALLLVAHQAAAIQVSDPDYYADVANSMGSMRPDTEMLAQLGALASLESLAAEVSTFDENNYDEHVLAQYQDAFQVGLNHDAARPIVTAFAQAEDKEAFALA